MYQLLGGYKTEHACMGRVYVCGSNVCMPIRLVQIFWDVVAVYVACVLLPWVGPINSCLIGGCIDARDLKSLQD